ncbi:MAG TPA: C2 family cysteine protease, partial [Tepidisphaeraceae bacterium]|nr:C2 family cysteine protease [Tepidisphaeraceae bacterium]
DSAGSERFLDMCAEEVTGGADHRIASFTNGSTKVSKELLGQRLADPTTSYTYNTFSDRKLFSSNGPTADDVKQGQTGDCYFLATLASVAETDDNVIKQSVVDLGDGTYAVQFAKYDGTKTFVRVDNDLATFSWNHNTPAYANFGASGSMWVAVIEKAFTYFRTGVGTYNSISSGFMSEAYTALGTSSNTWTASNSNDLISQIEAQLAAGKSVTAACFTNPSGCNMVTSHAYTVDHIVDNGDGTKSVVVRNPWGVDGYSCNDGHNDGYVTLTAAQAFAALTYLTSAAV